MKQPISLLVVAAALMVSGFVSTAGVCAGDTSGPKYIPLGHHAADSLVACSRDGSLMAVMGLHWDSVNTRTPDGETFTTRFPTGVSLEVWSLDRNLRPVARLFRDSRAGPFSPARMVWAGRHLLYSGCEGTPSLYALWTKQKDVRTWPRYVKGYAWSEGLKAPASFPPAALAAVMLPTQQPERVVIINNLADLIEHWDGVKQAPRKEAFGQSGIGVYSVPDGARMAHVFTSIRGPDPEGVLRSWDAQSPFVPLFVDAATEYLFALSDGSVGTTAASMAGSFLRIELHTGAQSPALSGSEDTPMFGLRRFNEMALPCSLDNGQAFAVRLDRPERLDGFCYRTEWVKSGRSELTCLRAHDGKIVPISPSYLIAWTDDGTLLLGDGVNITEYDPRTHRETLVASDLDITWVGDPIPGVGGLLVQAERLTSNKMVGPHRVSRTYSDVEWGVLVTGHSKIPDDKDRPR